MLFGSCDCLDLPRLSVAGVTAILLTLGFLPRSSRTSVNSVVVRVAYRFHLLLPRSNVAGSTAIPLTLGLNREVTPRQCILSGWDTILYPCMCVMRYHDLVEPGCPYSPLPCQRLDVGAAADMCVRERDASKTLLYTVMSTPKKR